MSQYQIITYKLKKSAKPAKVLQVIETLMQKYNVGCEDRLFKAEVAIVDIEIDGTVCTNREKNAVVSLCRKYSSLAPFFRHDKGKEPLTEKMSVQNFSTEDFSKNGDIDHALIRELVAKIPRPYSVHELELILSGLYFDEVNTSLETVKPSKDGFGPPVGNYIYYTRSSYGDERHDYILFSAKEENIAPMRDLFFDFAGQLPGRYQGTEVQNG